MGPYTPFVSGQCILNRGRRASERWFDALFKKVWNVWVDPKTDTI